MDRTDGAAGIPAEQQAEDAAALAATEAALQGKGLVLLSCAPLVVCRAIDTTQTDPDVLDVSSCGLQECCMLEGEAQLRRLALVGNALPALLPGHLSGLAQLSRLDASRNRLAELAGLAALPRLVELRLARNRLTEAALDHITGLSRLTLLDLHANRLASLVQLAALTRLRELNAAANRLSQLPRLGRLSQLTALNLRRNALASLQPAAAAAQLATDEQQGDCISDSSSSSGCLPTSLVRLSLAQNLLSQPGALLPLRGLPCLAELSLEGNPWQQRGGSSSRAELLCCCPPSLLLLDGQVVSPSERGAMLTSAVKAGAAARGGTAAAAGGAAVAAGAGAGNSEVTVSTLLGMGLAEKKLQQWQQQLSTEQQQIPGALQGYQQQQQRQGVAGAHADDRLLVQQVALLAAAGSAELAAGTMQVQGQHLQARHKLQQQQQQQQGLAQAPEAQQRGGQQANQAWGSSLALVNAASPAAGGSMELPAALEAPRAVEDAPAADAGDVDRNVCVGHQLQAGHISSEAEVSAGAAPDTDSSSVRKLRHLGSLQQQQQQQQADACSKLSIAAKLRPYSADDVALHASSSSSSSSRPGAIRAARGPGSLAAYAAFAAARAAGAPTLPAGEHDRPGAATAHSADTAAAGGDACELAQEPTVLPCSGDDSSSDNSSEHSFTHDAAEQQQPLQQHDSTAAAVQLAAAAAAPAQPGPGAGAAAPTAAPQATPGQQLAAAAAAAGCVLAPAERYQGPLAFAAVACGVMLPGAAAAAEGCPQQYGTAGVFMPAGAGAGDEDDYDHDEYTAAAAAGAGATISTAELEARYLQARQAVVGSGRRRQAGPSAVTPPPAAPAAPGVTLTGSRLLLSGAPALACLRGEALPHVSHLTLDSMAYSKVCACMPLLCGLPRLSSLALQHLAGLASLPQLHPLLRLPGLRHLAVGGCPLAGLVLLRPYVAFRFPSLQSFNDLPISPAEVVAAAELFGPLEAALAAALAQAPQQAALAGSGVLRAKGARQAAHSNRGNDSSSSGGSSQATTDTVWLAGSSCGAVGSAPGSGELGEDASEAPAAAAAFRPGSCGVSVSAVFAAMGAGPLLPPAPTQAQGAAWAGQLLGEAGQVQQQLAGLTQQAWPGLVEGSIREGWSG